MRDRKNRRVATATRLRLKRRKQKRYGRVQRGLGIIFFLCVGILSFFFIRQLRDDAGQRQMMQEMTAAKEGATTEMNANQPQNDTNTSTRKLTRPCAGVELALQEIFNKAYELQKQAQTEPVMLPEYAALHEQNSDIIGWLRIEGTVIDYPVMQTMDDEDYYLDYDFNGDANSNGSLILDTDSTAGVGTAQYQYINGTPPSTNLIIHGHTMRQA